MDSIIADMAGRVFSDHVTHLTRSQAAAGIWPTSLWQEIEQAGLPLALVPEGAGGFGVGVGDALSIVRIAGAHGLPVPLAETMLANWLQAQAGLPVSLGPQSVTDGSGLSLRATDDGWSVSGQIEAVPWGRNADRIVTLVPHDGKNMVVALPAERLAFDVAYNLAGEPRDSAAAYLALRADQVGQVALPADTLTLMGALLRSLLMAGALETVMTLCVTYAGDRVQFGRPIGKFQAIQQYLATMAGEVAAARAAADMVADGFDATPSRHLVAAAKLRAGEAGQIVAALAHQVHGAIGFTDEHSLHHFTKRLWSWRDEFGTERDWSRALGKAALKGGPAGSDDSFWSFVTATSAKGVAA